MFRASSCPSSGATTAVAASGLPLELGDSSAVGRGRADHDQQHSYHIISYSLKKHCYRNFSDSLLFPISNSKYRYQNNCTVSSVQVRPGCFSPTVIKCIDFMKIVLWWRRQVICLKKVSVFYQATRCHTPKDSHIHILRVGDTTNSLTLKSLN